jgi:hypothetical protein
MGIARWRAQRRQLPIAAEKADVPDFLVAPSEFAVAADAEATPGPSEPVAPSATRAPLTKATPPAAKPVPGTPVTATAVALTVSDAEFEAALVLDHQFGELDELVEDDPETFSTWVAEAAESVALVADEHVDVDLDLSPAHAVELARADEGSVDEIAAERVSNDAASAEVDSDEVVEAARLDVEPVLAVDAVEEPVDHAEVEAVMAQPSDRTDDAAEATDTQDLIETGDGYEVDVIEAESAEDHDDVELTIEFDEVDEVEALTEAAVEPEGPMPVDADEVERRLTKGKERKAGEPIIVPGVLAAMRPSPEDGPRDADAAELSRLLFPEHNDKGDLVH